MTKKIIETDRLILRPLTVADAQDVFEWTGDEIVDKYMPYPVHKDVQQSAEWISSLGAWLCNGGVKGNDTMGV